MHKQQRGVTLLELMTAVAVLAILAGIGVPAFTSMMRNNRLAAESNNLVQALTYARSEAVTRGVRVSVCAAEDPNTCSGEGDWSGGWIVFTDDFGAAGEIDPSDVVIMNWPAAAGVQITSTGEAVTFTRTGRAEFAQGFGITKAGCTQKQRRSIGVAASGRVTLAHTSCENTLEDDFPTEEVETEEESEG